MAGTTGARRNRVVELFAGVGRVPARPRGPGWRTVWANQWEPSTKAQHAVDCYTVPLARRAPWSTRTSPRSSIKVPAHDLLVGGFPCQDYSVAKIASQAQGSRASRACSGGRSTRSSSGGPEAVFLENVDRLLKSPTSQRGRDFAIILSCLNGLGYMVEWRVVNAAEYGFPQRRKRVFIVATKLPKRAAVDPTSTIFDGRARRERFRCGPSRTWTSISKCRPRARGTRGDHGPLAERAHHPVPERA